MEFLQNMSFSPSILIVEDDKVAREMIGSVVQKKFRDVTIYLAENGRIGVDLFKEHSPEIVITDINMPVMDGIEMANEIKLIKADSKFIVMTAYSNKDYFESFSKIGFCEYLLKPVVFSKLYVAIEKCIAEM